MKFFFQFYESLAYVYTDNVKQSTYYQIWLEKLKKAQRKNSVKK